MLSTSALKSLSISLKLSIIFKVTPYHWNEKTQMLSLDNRIQTKALFCFVTLAMIFHSCFTAWRCVQYILFLGGSTAKFLLLVTFASETMLGAIIQLNTVLGKLELLEVINKFLEYDRFLTGAIIHS